MLRLSGRALVFFFSSRRRHTRSKRDWSSDVCSSDLRPPEELGEGGELQGQGRQEDVPHAVAAQEGPAPLPPGPGEEDVLALHHEIGRASCRERANIERGARGWREEGKGATGNDTAGD